VLLNFSFLNVIRSKELLTYFLRLSLTPLTGKPTWKPESFSKQMMEHVSTPPCRA
jgi:hypothetical protein